MRHLEENGFSTTVKPFFTKRAHFAFYQSGNLLSKIHALIESYWRRLPLLLHARSFDFIFVHREATPAGPPFIEWWLAKVLHKRIIYDFDDAIWLTDKKGESQITRLLRSRSKVRSVCRWSYRISCGNEYLAAYARNYNARVKVNPTTIDLSLHSPVQNPNQVAEIVTIGWTGSSSTLKYLEPLVPILQSLEKKYSVEILVIADRNPRLPFENFRFQPWKKETEIADLSQMDIGIMPLPLDEWSQGKCGFKALQYMALGIPAAVSPVGINKEIVQHGCEGYCCNSPSEWFQFLERLILDPALRKRMGERGCQKVKKRYSTASNAATFLSLFQ